MTRAVPLGGRCMLSAKSSGTNPIRCPLATTAAITTPIDTELYEERRNRLGRTPTLAPYCYPNPKPTERADMPTIEPDNCRADMPATRLSDLSINAFIDTRRVLIDNHRIHLQA